MSFNKSIIDILADFQKNKGIEKVAKGIGLGVGGLGIMSFMVGLDNKARSREYKNLQRKNLNKQIKDRNDSQLVKDAYNFEVRYKSKPEDMVLPDYTGLTQELFKRKTGHSNSWGGRKY